MRKSQCVVRWAVIGDLPDEAGKEGRYAENLIPTGHRVSHGRIVPGELLASWLSHVHTTGPLRLERPCLELRHRGNDLHGSTVLVVKRPDHEILRGMQIEVVIHGSAVNTTLTEVFV